RRRRNDDVRLGSPGSPGCSFFDQLGRNSDQLPKYTPSAWRRTGKGASVRASSTSRRAGRARQTWRAERGPVSSLLHRRDLGEVVGEGLDATCGLAPVVVLVGGVVAVLGEAEADADDRRLEVLLHGDDGADGAAFADEGGGGAEAEADRVAGGVG